MFGHLFERLTSSLDTGQSQTVGGAADTRSETSLFHCPGCNTVYISTEMSTCACCQQPVETVPTATDLGWTR